MDRNRFCHLATGILALAGIALFAGTRADAGPATAPRRGEDRGFVIVLTSPNEPYLVGSQTLAAEVTVPEGDGLDQVSFLVDGKLVFTAQESPFTFDYDFGTEIERHTIVASGVTHSGRRARASFISRSADISDSAASVIAVVPAVVRDADGLPVEGLSVSDFTLLENGIDQQIVHFDSEPFPASIVVGLYAAGDPADTWTALTGGAAALTNELPWHHSLALLGGRLDKPPKERGEEVPCLEFLLDREIFLGQLQESAANVPPAGAGPLSETLFTAAASLRSRVGTREIILLVGGTPAGERRAVRQEPVEESSGEEEAETTPETSTEDDAVEAIESPSSDDAGTPPESPPQAEAGADSEPPLQIDPLLDALEELKLARVTIHVVSMMGEDGTALAALRQAAEATGGEFHAASDPDGVDEACRTIADSLLHRYLIAYLPPQPLRPGWRSIDVKVRQPNLRVNAPSGYSTR